MTFDQSCNCGCHTEDPELCESCCDYNQARINKLEALLENECDRVARVKAILKSDPRRSMAILKAVEILEERYESTGAGVVAKKVSRR